MILNIKKQEYHQGNLFFYIRYLFILFIYININFFVSILNIKIRISLKQQVGNFILFILSYIDNINICVYIFNIKNKNIYKEIRSQLYIIVY